MGPRKIGLTKPSQCRQRTSISKKKNEPADCATKKTKFNKLLPTSYSDAEWKHVLGEKSELTQCPRHADVFTYPRPPSVHTGHPMLAHTHPPTNCFLVMRCGCAKNNNLCDLIHVTTNVFLDSLHTSLSNSLQECMLPRKVRHNCHHGRQEWILCVGGSTHCCTDMTWQTRVMTRICAVHDPHLLEIASPMPPSHDGRSFGTTDVSKAYAACI